ncbi:polysaccharide deacetylase family protein [Mesorhizobium yinganensis]|uniref:polysaccharide deacetylase family protein n=1 Tax=Mesorhizobium yinganensis TaxID=3157707 RepID=UPI0032B828D6
MKLLIVNFHYIREETYAGGIYPRTVCQLAEQVDCLSRHYQFIAPAELAAMTAGNRRDGNFCLLTFDDGLKEQMAALDLLQRKGVPAAFYVTTAPIRDHVVADVHKLHYIRSVVTDIQLFDLISQRIDLSAVTYPEDIDRLYRYDPPESKRLKYLLNFILTADEKDRIVRAFFAEIADEPAYSASLYMDAEDLMTLSSLDYLGAHGDAHLPLATLSTEGIRQDTGASLDFLRQQCGTKSIHSISYPFGGPKAVSRTVAEISAGYGFAFGLTMIRGVNEDVDMETPFLLKRVDTNDAPGGKLGSTEYCI